MKKLLLGFGLSPLRASDAPTPAPAERRHRWLWRNFQRRKRWLGVRRNRRDAGRGGRYRERWFDWRWRWLGEHRWNLRSRSGRQPARAGSGTAGPAPRRCDGRRRASAVPARGAEARGGGTGRGGGGGAGTEAPTGGARAGMAGTGGSAGRLRIGRELAEEEAAGPVRAGPAPAGHPRRSAPAPRSESEQDRDGYRASRQVVIETNSAAGIKVRHHLQARNIRGRREVSESSGERVAARRTVTRTWRRWADRLVGILHRRGRYAGRTGACAGRTGWKAFLTTSPRPFPKTASPERVLPEPRLDEDRRRNGFSCGGLMSGDVSGDPRFTAIGSADRRPDESRTPPSTASPHAVQKIMNSGLERHRL